jgi:hypothetical protein
MCPPIPAVTLSPVFLFYLDYPTLQVSGAFSEKLFRGFFPGAFYFFVIGARNETVGTLFNSRQAL